jgi:dTDP-4-dehydrorhamnose 3,5-epimerase
MDATTTGIDGSWLLTPVRHHDERGWFQEWFRRSDIASSCGVDFVPAQANISRSDRGTVRGVHYSTATEGQAKLVTVMAGIIDDYVVDVRPSSATFGRWIRRRLTADDGTAMLIGGDLGHAFQALVDGTVVAYLVSSEHDPSAEFAISPFCHRLAIDWADGHPVVVSDRDRSAPDLDGQLAAGRLPRD